MDRKIMYGIPNCGSVKKAKAWLEENGHKYEFHDYKKLGIDKTHLQKWATVVGWEILVNRKGTTWRKLPEETKNSVTTGAKAIKLMMENTSLIKRPVITIGNDIVVGYDEETYSATFKK